MTATRAEYLKRVDEVEGWFPAGDRVAFSIFGELQEKNDVRGHLLEIGVFFGKSAILLGFLQRPDEEFVVCDLFEDPAHDELNQREMAASYHSRSLTRTGFEENYLKFHATLPQIEQRPSGELKADALPSPMRFIHVDGSHMYDHARSDLLLSRELLGDNGVVVIDDYRTAHTPGVAAATWQAVINEGFIPLCVTHQKMYGTWNRWDADLLQQLHQAWAEHPKMMAKTSEVAGTRFLRLLWKTPHKVKNGGGAKSGPA